MVGIIVLICLFVAIWLMVAHVQSSPDASLIQAKLKPQQKVLRSCKPSIAGQFSTEKLMLVKSPFERARRVYDCTYEDRFGALKSCTIYVQGGDISITGEKTLRKGRSMYDDIG